VFLYGCEKRLFSISIRNSALRLDRCIGADGRRAGDFGRIITFGDVEGNKGDFLAKILLKK